MKFLELVMIKELAVTQHKTPLQTLRINSKLLPGLLL